MAGLVKNRTKPHCETMTTQPKNIAIYVTCLVDLFRPSIAFASIKVLEAAGYHVHVSQQQTCCGQPAFNSGDRAKARSLAKQVIAEFEGFDALVLPSGSCAAMIVKNYPELFEQSDGNWADRAQVLAAKTYELTAFLVDVAGQLDFKARYHGKVTYHDSCSGLRDLSIKQQPRQLLAHVQGLELVEMGDSERCCGFGGTFSVKYGDISGRIVGDKASDIAKTGAELLLGGDLGCLMNMAGKLSREGSSVEVRHIAEVLAEMLDSTAIAQSEKG